MNINECHPDFLSDGLERIADSARFLGMSRGQIYKLINLGMLPSVKLGRSRRVPVRAVRDLARAHLVQNSERAE